MKDWHFSIFLMAFCIFLLGVFYFNACCMQDMQTKIDEYIRITERLEKEIIKQQELDKRILEQNIELSMKVRLRGDD